MQTIFGGSMDTVQGSDGWSSIRWWTGDFVRGQWRSNLDRDRNRRRRWWDGELVTVTPSLQTSSPATCTNDRAHVGSGHRRISTSLILTTSIILKCCANYLAICSYICTIIIWKAIRLNSEKKCLVYDTILQSAWVTQIVEWEALSTYRDLPHLIALSGRNWKRRHPTAWVAVIYLIAVGLELEKKAKT